MTSWPWRSLGEVTIPGSNWNPRLDPRPMIRYIDVSAVSRDELRVVSEATYSSEDAPSRARKFVKTGDTIFATVRPTLRRIAQIPASLDGEIVSTAFCVLRPNPSLIHPDFLYFALQLEPVVDSIANVQSGASYPAVRDVDVLNQAVPLPPLQTQYRIAAALNLVRTSMLHHNECARISSILKRAAMRELFTRGLRGEAQKETEIGPMPESWRTAQLGQVADVVSTRMAYTELKNTPQAFGKDTIRVLGIKVADMNLPGNEVELQSAALERIVRRDIAHQRCAPPRTIIFPKRGAAIATNKKRISKEWTVFDPNVIGVVAGSELCQDFLFQWFQMFDLRTITDLGPTPQLNKKNLLPLNVPIPSTLDEQRDVVAILDAIDRKIDLHRRKRAVLDELFNALLRKLMTGEIRIADLNLNAIGTNVNDDSKGHGQTQN